LKTNHLATLLVTQERGHVVKAFIILTTEYQDKIASDKAEEEMLVAEIQVD
jgi:hypothetical protein